MAKHSIEVADFDAARGVVVLTEEGGDIVVRGAVAELLP